MKFIMVSALLFPISVHAQDTCPALVGTYANCVTSVRHCSNPAKQFIIVQNDNQYAIQQIGSLGNVDSINILADGQVNTQSETSATYGNLAISSQYSCADSSLVASQTVTLADKAVLESSKMSLYLNDQDKLLVSLDAATNVPSSGDFHSATICSRVK